MKACFIFFSFPDVKSINYFDEKMIENKMKIFITYL